MDNAQILERFSRLEARLTEVAQLCHRTSGSPPALNEALEQVEHRSHEVRRALEDELGETAEDPARVFECADLLKEAGDRAAALTDGEGVTRELHDAVEEVQNEIAHLRRQLHGSGNRREQRPLHRPASR